MIYPYPVKHNGIWYPAWTEVPVGKPKPEQVESNEAVEQTDEESASVIRRHGGRPRKK